MTDDPKSTPATSGAPLSSGTSRAHSISTLNAMPATRGLANALKPEKDNTIVKRRWGTVATLNGDGTLDVTVSGITVPGMPKVSWYRPAVGDKVRVDVVGTDMVCTGPVGENAANTFTTTSTPVNAFAEATGPIDMGSQTIVDVHNPIAAQDAATKNYVDTAISSLTASLPKPSGYYSAMYSRSSNQGIPVAQNTNIIPNSTFYNRNGGTTVLSDGSIRLNVGGEWAFDFSVRFDATTAAGEYFCAIKHSNGIVLGGSSSYMPINNLTGVPTIHCGGSDRFTSNDSVAFYVYYGSGSNQVVAVFNMPMMQLRWIGP